MNTKTSIVTIFLGISLITSANAQWWGNETIKGNGTITTENRKVGNYDKISVAGSFDVELISGAEGNLSIEAEENLIKHIETKINDDVLKIHVEKGYELKPSKNKKIQITVPFESISKVSLAGSGEVTTKNAIKADRFAVNLAGSGNMTLALDTNTLKGNVAGSGNLKLNGKTTDFECDIAGSGDVYAFDLKTENTTVSVSGSGNASVYCDESLKARVVGSGDVTYKGNPKKEDNKVLGSGKINKE